MYIIYFLFYVFFFIIINFSPSVLKPPATAVYSRSHTQYTTTILSIWVLVTITKFIILPPTCARLSTCRQLLFLCSHATLSTISRQMWWFTLLQRTLLRHAHENPLRKILSRNNIHRTRYNILRTLAFSPKRRFLRLFTHAGMILFYFSIFYIFPPSG